MGVTVSTESKPSIVGTTDEIRSFNVTEAYGVIITNQVYRKTSYQNIDQVVENAATIKRTFEFLNITNITEFTDSTMEDFEIFL
jgi:hypothetical protein